VQEQLATRQAHNRNHLQ